MAYSMDGGGHLAVPGSNSASRERYPAEHRESGHRSRSPSPSSSRGTSPTLTSISLPNPPLVSGGPYSRQHNALAIQAISSTHSLHHLHPLRTNRSTSSLHSGSANSSRIDIRIKGPDSPEDDAESMECDVADHDPDRATLEDKGNDDNDDNDDRPTPITPEVVEDKKYYHRPMCAVMLVMNVVAHN
ncbi:hypothetical protein EIP86_006063 [Pleurotus ostreatoroseus]|nr:hypothetical protein EIP86_006063 [Pleurotus ostreatoroseus]